MKTTHLIILFICSILHSCSTEEHLLPKKMEEHNNETFISLIDTCKFINAQRAKHVAKLFMSNPKISRNSNEIKETEDIQTIKDENGTILLYIINYNDNKGFVIVSVTQNYYPVLAHSDNGNFNINQTSFTGVSLWLNEQSNIIKSAYTFPDSIKQKYRNMWVKYNTYKAPITKSRNADEVTELININIQQWETDGYSVYRYADIKNTTMFEDLPIEIKTEIHNAIDSADPRYGGREYVTFILRKEESIFESVPPLIQSKWSQNNGYNYYTPNNYPVGCVAVAMGQIMKFHEYPTNYDWDSMHNTNATTTTASFLAEIGEEVDMEYSAKGSSSNIDKALAAFKNHYGYLKAKKEEHNIPDVVSELSRSCPVYMRGYDSSGFLGLNHEGHAWVCDGYYNSTINDANSTNKCNELIGLR